MTHAAPATGIPTAPIVAAGLLGGYTTARVTGVRPLGGVVLAAAGAAAYREWIRGSGPVAAGVLITVYVAGFGASHPLARRIGAWPSLLAVTAASAGAAYALHDRAR